MISVVSPGYVHSAWCLGELREFSRLAAQTGGLIVGNESRLLKVVKSYVPREWHPPELRNHLGYEFYEQDLASGRPVEFSDGLGRERDQRYWDKLDNLAYDVGQILSAVKAGARTPPDVPAAVEAPLTAPGTHDVFICYSSRDQGLAGEVRNALQGAGVTCWIASEDILPGENYGRAIVKAINSCRLVLLAFTSAANASPHVLNEIDRAFNKKKPVILLRCEDVPLSEDLEYYLSTGSWLDASEPPASKHLPVPVEKVKRLLARPPHA